MKFLKDQAYENLIEMIRNGALEYGSIYSIKALAVQLDMSVTPVRDAVMRLCDEGRMDMLPSRGVRLHKFTKEELIQHYHFSNAIEGYCVASLARNFRSGNGEKHVKRLEKLVDELEKCIERRAAFPEYFSCDKGFHQAILESLEDSYFTGLQFSAMGFYDHPELQYDSEENRKMILSFHRAILSAVKSGDPVLAYKELIRHSEFMLDHSRDT